MAAATLAAGIGAAARAIDTDMVTVGTAVPNVDELSGEDGRILGGDGTSASGIGAVSAGTASNESEGTICAATGVTVMAGRGLSVYDCGAPGFACMEATTRKSSVSAVAVKALG